jgi:hypothetical protein
MISDALIYLMSYGDASAEEPVWHRYVQWSEMWKGHEDKLEERAAGTSGNWEEIGVGENLARTLIAGQGWLANRDLIAQVMERCVDKSMCEHLGRIAAAAQQAPFVVTAYSAGTTSNFQVAQYETKSLELLEAKVAQYPKGTKFTIAEQQSDNSDQRALDARVRAIFEKKGMALVPPPAAVQAAN